MSEYCACGKKELEPTWSAITDALWWKHTEGLRGPAAPQGRHGHGVGRGRAPACDRHRDGEAMSEDLIVPASGSDLEELLEKIVRPRRARQGGVRPTPDGTARTGAGWCTHRTRHSGYCPLCDETRRY